MNNVTVFNPSQVPAFARNRGELGPLSKSLAGGGDTGNRISIRGGVFRLISGGKELAAVEERYLDVVIVNAAQHISRVFYLKKWDPENPAAPDCYSADGKTPDKDSSNKQADTCASCPQNIAGSGQGDSRACRYQQRLAVVLANNIEGDVLQLALPATSIFGREDGENRPLQAYARWLAAQNVDPGEVVTRLRFDTKSESPKLFFKAMRWLTDDEHASAQEQGKTPDAVKAVTMTVAKIDGVAAPLANTLPGKRPGQAAAPAPAAQEEEEAPAPAADDEPPPPPPKRRGRPPKSAAEPAAAPEEVAEPEVRKTEKPATAVPPKNSKLAEAVAAWDDED